MNTAAASLFFVLSFTIIATTMIIDSRAGTCIPLHQRKKMPASEEPSPSGKETPQTPLTCGGFKKKKDTSYIHLKTVDLQIQWIQLCGLYLDDSASMNSSLQASDRQSSSQTPTEQKKGQISREDYQSPQTPKDKTRIYCHVRIPYFYSSGHG
jgi:hypothetical protein